MGYLKRTSNYPKILVLSDLTHMRSLSDAVSISVETVRIDSECYLEKEFTELISMKT